MKERSGMPYDVVAFESDELTSKLTADAEGILHRMIRKAWMNGSVPADLTELAGLCRVNPRTMRKVWPQLAPMWTPIPANPSRIFSKKIESERNFLESKRKSAQRSANARWNKQKTKEVDDANAMLYSNASPPLPIPPQHIKKVKTSSLPKKDKIPVNVPDDFSISDGMKSWAAAHKFEESDIQRETPAMIDHFRASGVKKCDWEATWRNWMRNSTKYRGNGNGNGNHKTRQDRTREAMDRVVRRLYQQNSGGVQRGIVGGDDGGVHGSADDGEF